MKFGMIGGIGPASTADYYKGIIDLCIHSGCSYPELVIDSIDMNRMCGYFEEGNESDAVSMLVSSIYNVKAAGAQAVAIASNTPHILYEEIARHSPLPILSIVDETCAYISEKTYKRVLFLGTGFTMKSGLYTKPLAQFGVKVLTPCPDDALILHKIIYPNLENGIVIAADKTKMIDISERYIRDFHLDAVILGCTEIPLMIQEGDLSVPVINTMQIHIASIAKKILSDVPETEFDSTYCHVQYLEKERAVLLAWREFASFENYRKPTRFALDLMQKYPVTSFIVDARKGFEDETEDAKWGFSWLLPHMKKTTCETVIFVMNEQQSTLDEEMDMWTNEFRKYFTVRKFVSLEEALHDCLRMPQNRN